MKTLALHGVGKTRVAVNEHDGYAPPLVLYSRPLGQDLLSKPFREILMNLRKLFIKGEIFWQGCFCRRPEIATVYQAELARRWISFPAPLANDFKRLAEFVTKSGTLRKLNLALWPLHGFPRRT